ncbi:hypothetical protein ON010_g15863 [Phytophthora cinnamomi]|nr:hypothetical protein ON010_g15863 [Phytophthora cinnamomi]
MTRRLRVSSSPLYAQGQLQSMSASNGKALLRWGRVQLAWSTGSGRRPGRVPRRSSRPDAGTVVRSLRTSFSCPEAYLWRTTGVAHRAEGLWADTSSRAQIKLVLALSLIGHEVEDLVSPRSRPMYFTPAEHGQDAAAAEL